MAIQRSEGVLLRRQDLRETSIIITFYTRDFGKIRGVIKGARGTRAPGGGAAFELFAYDDVVFYERRKSDLATVSQCDLIEYFPAIRLELDRLSYASYMIELLDAITELAVAQPAVFELLMGSLRLLDAGASPRRVARVFEIRLLDLLGMIPSLISCAHCGSVAGEESARFSFRHGGLLCASCRQFDPSAAPILAGTINFIEHIRAIPFEKVDQVKVAEKVGQDLESILRKFIDYHLDHRLKTLSFLRAIGQ